MRVRVCVCVVVVVVGGGVSWVGGAGALGASQAYSGSRGWGVGSSTCRRDAQGSPVVSVKVSTYLRSLLVHVGAAVAAVRHAQF